MRTPAAGPRTVDGNAQMTARTKYSYRIDLRNLNTSHSLAVLSVPPGSRVLDLGAADGSVARALVERGCQVWGIEQNHEAAAAAATVCERVIVADLETEQPWLELRGEVFDAVLALDVLEHLRNPLGVLTRAAEHVAPAGSVVVSLPNVTHAAVRLSLLQGRFEYTEIGLLDSTHLRFFDRAHAERLLLDAGLFIHERLQVTHGVNETEIVLDLAAVAPELLRQISAAPDALTYQFLFVARRQPTISAVGDDGTLAERLQRDLTNLRARVADVEARAVSLEQQRDALSCAVDDERHRSDEQARHAEALARELELCAQLQRDRQRELQHAAADTAMTQALANKTRHELETETERAGALQHQIAHLTLEVHALRVYTGSAGFVVVERFIAGLKRIPFAYGIGRTVVRGLARMLRSRSD